MSALLHAAKAKEQGLPPAKPQRYALPKRVEDSARVFRHSELMKEVLGDELHAALVERNNVQGLGAVR
jgi:glutamine synthetase